MTTFLVGAPNKRRGPGGGCHGALDAGDLAREAVADRRGAVATTIRRGDLQALDLDDLDLHVLHLLYVRPTSPHGNALLPMRGVASPPSPPPPDATGGLVPP